MVGTHTFTFTFTLTVTVTVTDDDGAAASDMDVITANDTVEQLLLLAYLGASSSEAIKS